MNSSVLDDGRVASSAWESFEGCKDLNGDRDATDELAYSWEPRTGSVVPLGYAVTVNQPDSLGPERIGFMVYEAIQGRDRNGDGDMNDHVVHIATLAGSTPTTVPTSPTPPPGPGGSSPGAGPGPVPPAHSGYWLVTGDVLSAIPSGKGYWVFTNRGRAMAFGDAPFLGDVSSVKLNGPVLGSVATPSGKGYYIVASDGGIFSFGDAAFAGSMGGITLNPPVQSLVPDADGKGYWLVASDGAIFNFSDRRSRVRSETSRRPVQWSPSPRFLRRDMPGALDCGPAPPFSSCEQADVRST